MDTRVLYLTAIIIAAISGGYYYYSGKGNKLQTDSARSMTYSANNINLTQTDEKGMLSVRAQVDQLEQNLQLETSSLKICRQRPIKTVRLMRHFLPNRATVMMTIQKLYFLKKCWRPRSCKMENAVPHRGANGFSENT